MALMALALAACTAGDDPGRRVQALKNCGGVPVQGCCHLETLILCKNGNPVVASCLNAPKCGWNIGAKRYDCNTPGKADPSGKFPYSCMALDKGVPDMPPSDGTKSDGAKADGSKSDAAKPDKGAPDVAVDTSTIKCGDGKCEKPQEDCEKCPADCGKCTGCEARDTPKCPTCACEKCVCGMDPYCCNKKWDSVCVTKCKTKCGGCKVAVVVPDVGLPEAGLPDGPQCGDGWCTPPKEDCQLCPADCGICTGCQIRPSPGCKTCACEACVCAQDPDCCKYGWDALCVDRCKKKCGGCKVKIVDAAVVDLPLEQGLLPDKTLVADKPKGADKPKLADLPPPPDKTKSKDLSSLPPDQAAAWDMPLLPDKTVAPDKLKSVDQSLHDQSLSDQSLSDQSLSDQPMTVDQAVVPDQPKTVDKQPAVDLAPGDQAGDRDTTSADRSLDSSKPDRSATSGDHGAEAGQPPSPDEGGCSCHAAGQERASTGLWLLILLALVRRFYSGLTAQGSRLS